MIRKPETRIMVLRPVRHLRILTKSGYVLYAASGKRISANWKNRSANGLGDEKAMVRSKGFEPLTPGTGNQCSIQLSYERAKIRGSASPKQMCKFT